MRRGEVDVERYADVVDSALLERLRAAMTTAASEPAEVVIDSQQRVVERARRTRSVDVPDELATLTRQRLDGLRPRLESRFSTRLASCEQPQFLRYEVGDRFLAHQDGAAGAHDDSPLSRRHVSVVLFVTGRKADSACGDVAGGQLMFFDTSPSTTWQTCRVPIHAPAGAAVAFRSDAIHEVTPVRRGQRLSVVTWFGRVAETDAKNVPSSPRREHHDGGDDRRAGAA
ncbi:MAG: 2OG-Fe(II) oxygenase [Conexibacter sp.]